MKKLIFWLLLISAAFGQQVNTDLVPASPGLKLGHTNQRWDANIQNLDVTGTCKIKGVPCGNGGGNGKGGCIATASSLSSTCGTVAGTIASITDGVNAADCTVGNGTTVSSCIYTGFIWTPTGGNVSNPNINNIKVNGGSVLTSPVNFQNGSGTTAVATGSNVQFNLTSVIQPGSYTCANLTVGADGRLTAAQNGTCTGGGGGANPGGLDKQLQVNNATTFDGIINAVPGSVLASAGASAYPVFQTKPVIDVRDYGVVGDGSTDDTTAFQNAITAACGSTLGVSPGAMVILPSKAQIKVTSTLNVNGCGGFLLDGESGTGQAGYSAVILWAGGMGGTVLSINRTRDSTFQNFTIAALNGSNIYNIGMDIDENAGSGITSHNRFRNIEIAQGPGGTQNTNFVGIRVGQNAPGNVEQQVFEDVNVSCGGGTLTNTSNGVGFQINKLASSEPFYVAISRPEISGCSHGVEISGNSRQVILDGGNYGPNFHSLYLNSGDGVVLQNIVTTQDTSSSIYLNGYSGVLTIRNNAFTGAGANVIDITNTSGGAKISVENNNFGGAPIFTGTDLPGSYTGYIYAKGNTNFAPPCPTQLTHSFGTFVQNVPTSGACDDIYSGTSTSKGFDFYSRSDTLQNSPPVRFGGAYQSAPATFATDYWQWQDIVGAGTNGTSTLTLTHAGSANAAPTLDLSANTVKVGLLTSTSTTQVPNLNASLLLGATWAAPLPIGTTTPPNATVNNLTINGSCSGCGGGGGSGSVTNIATTTPLSGGPITTTGTLTCPTCVVAPVNPVAGIAHFAGATQTATSSGIVDTDISGIVGISHGGTNASTAPGALVNLLPAGTRIGDMLYCSAYAASACTTWSLVAGNTGSTQWLQQTASGVPSWTVPPGAGTVAVVGAGTLGSTALVTGGGTQLVQTPAFGGTAANSTTLDASGNISVNAGGSVGSGDTGTPKFTFGTNLITANRNLTGLIFSGTGFQISGAAANRAFLIGNGTSFVSGTLQVGDIPSLNSLYLPLNGGTLTGNLLFTDASYDIGQPTTTRPRNLYVGGLSTSQVQAPVINATTGFQIGGAAPNGHFLTGTGTFYADNSRLIDDGTTLNYTGSGGIAASSLSITSPFQIYTSLPVGAFSCLASNSGFGVASDGDWYFCNDVNGPYKIITTNSLTFDLVKSGTSTGKSFIIGTGSSLAPTSATVGSVIANNLIFGSTALSTSTIPADGTCLGRSGLTIIGLTCSGGGGTTTNALTFNNGGAGAASGTTFDGSAARTISYNTLGAAASTAATTVNGVTCPLGSSCNVEAAVSGQVAISGGPGAALTGASDLTYNSGTHTFATTAAGIFDFSASAATNGLIVPSFSGAAAGVAGALVYDNSLAANYHVMTGSTDSVVAVIPTASLPVTGDVIDNTKDGNGHIILHDTGKLSANLVTASNAATSANQITYSSSNTRLLSYATVDNTITHVLHATAGAPAFSALLTTDLPTAIPLANLATIGADFAVVNNTGSTAVPSAIAIGSCSSASNALTYNTTTHVFGCNTISGSGTVNSGTTGHLSYYASPGGTAVSDLGVDLIWNGTHTLTGAATLIFDMSALTGATNVKFPSGVPLTSPVLTTPALGTPASGVLTNATGLPAAAIVAGTMAANMVIPTPSVTTQAIDCHAACTGGSALTAAQLSNAIVSNITGSTAQANSAVAMTGPTVAAGMSFVLILGSAEGASATWTYNSNTANVYLDGGTVKTSIIFGNNATIGTSVSCFSFPISGAFALKCTTLAGTVTTS